MAVTLPTVEKYARLWTKDRKQIYTFRETDTNLNHPYQLRINTFTSWMYVYDKWVWYEFSGDLYVYEWANYRERTEDDWMAIQVQNQKINLEEDEDDGD